MNAIIPAKQAREATMIDPSQQTFAPAADTSKLFRSALGKFGTGVTIVTTNGVDGPVGMTVNSFASVSLDPPLVLWSPSKSSHRYKYFDQEDRFAIHVLSSDQEWMANHFTRRTNSIDACDWALSKHGVPVIRGVVAHFECEKHTTIDAGDHAVVVGRVLQATVSDKQPLIFCAGQYGKFVGAA